MFDSLFVFYLEYLCLQHTVYFGRACWMSYLEVVVLEDRASSVRGHIGHGCHVNILAGEEEEIHTTTLCHTVLGQLLIHSFQRLEEGLWKIRHELGEIAAFWNGILTF